MSILSNLKKILKESNRRELEKTAKQEAIDFFNIELRNDKSCITFHNVIINEDSEDIVATLFKLRELYYNDKINNVIK